MLWCNNSSQSTVRNKIIEEYRLHETKNSQIKIAELTGFQWDQLFVFNEGASLAEINSVLGFKYQNYKEFSRKLIFLSGNKIVYFEEEEYNPSMRPNNSVWFKFTESTSHYMQFTRTNAIFNITTDVIDEKVYYTLIPMQFP